MGRYQDLSWPALVEHLAADLAAARRGSERRDEELWAETRSRVAAYARRMVASLPGAPSLEVDDVVQRVMVKLLDGGTIARLRHAPVPVAYVAVMIRNTAADLLRRRTAERESLARFGYEIATVGAEEDSAVRTADLRAALAELDETDRALLRLRFWRGLAIGEIAALYDLSYSAVAVRLFRLLRRLRSRLETGSAGRTEMSFRER